MNGLSLAKATGANPRVVEACAFVDNSCRRDDDDEPGHGTRAARFAKSINASLLHLDGSELALLQAAAAGTATAK